MQVKGKIIKGIGGFYYVKTAECIYECKARGVFRKDNKKPLVGDDCLLEVTDEDKKIGNVTELYERKNELIRPAVANVDQALVIFAIAHPQPPLGLVDRMLILLEQQGLPCAVVFNKSDLDEGGAGENFKRIYESAGYKVFIVSAKEEKGLDELREYLKGKTTTVAGPSGVGKSTFCNMVLGEGTMVVGDISDRLKRGKHTTRHAELFTYKDGFITDTPGFTSLDLFEVGVLYTDVSGGYPEMIRASEGCRFADCRHIAERDCHVRELVGSVIDEGRYDRYREFYEYLYSRRPNSAGGYK